MSLGQFVEENQRLLSVLGVLTAMTVFSRQLPLAALSYVLSFFFLAATVTLWLELQERFPKNGRVKLHIFEVCVSMSILVLTFYWLLLYRSLWRQLLVVVFFVLINLALTSVIVRFDVFNRVFNARDGERTRSRHALYFALQAVLLAASLGLAALVGLPVNRLLDHARERLDQQAVNEIPQLRAGPRDEAAELRGAGVDSSSASRRPPD